MTAAKVLDVIARLLGCDGKAADAVSGYTQAKLEDAPRWLRIPKSGCPDFWTRFFRHKNGKDHGQTLKIQWYFLNEICTDTHLLSSHGERQFEEVLMELGWVKVPNWECLFVHRKQGLFYFVFVDDIKMAGKKQNMFPMWKKLMNNVDLGEPTSFLDHVYLVCTQRECKPKETNVEQYKKMFESRISVGTTDFERYCELANKKTAVVQSFNPLLG